MTLRDFTDSLETYGADLDRWPGDLAEQAIDLLAASTEAQDLFAAATAEDLALFPSKPAANGVDSIDRALGKLKTDR